jgi:sigma-B regulation protein RsbU (phosphoserine phosphatase)
VAKGNFDTPLPTFEHDDEIKQLRDSFDTMQHSLKRYVKELKETVTSKASMESELNIAHHIQMAMLPKTFPAFPHRNDIEIYGMLTPAKSVGGDLYDFMLRDDELFFCIGDVSGKGVPASLVMAVSRTLFRNVAAHVDKPHLIMEAMNDSICDGNDSCMFVTLFIGVLDLKTGHLRYCNAGHNPPYLQNKLLTSDANFPVGAIPGWEFIEEEVDIAPGETLFLYTDGLTEAEDASHKEFGDLRVQKMIVSSLAANDTPKQMIDNMTAAVRQFVGETEQSDDLTMLAIRYEKEETN